MGWPASIARTMPPSVRGPVSTPIVRRRRRRRPKSVRWIGRQSPTHFSRTSGGASPGGTAMMRTWTTAGLRGRSASERRVAVLLVGQALALVAQHAERGDEARARVGRLDDVVEVAELRRDP